MDTEEKKVSDEMEEAVKKAVADAHEQAAEEAESTVEADAETETDGQETADAEPAEIPEDAEAEESWISSVGEARRNLKRKTKRFVL